MEEKKSKKMHKMDLIFIVVSSILIIIGCIIDITSGINFPAFMIYSACIAYVILFVLLIYSSFEYKSQDDKPVFVRWYMLIPFVFGVFIGAFMFIIFLSFLILMGIIKNIIGIFI